MTAETSVAAPSDLGLWRTLEALAAEDDLNDWIFSRVEPYLGSRILEVGCGVGSFTRRLSQRGDVVALDPWLPAVVRCREVVGKDVTVLHGSIEEMTLNGDFDSAVCLNVIEHIKDDVEALRKMRSHLREGGNLVVLTPAHPWLYGSLDEEFGHYRRYRKAELERAVNMAGFKVVHLRHFNLIGLPGWLVATRILRMRELRPGLLGVYRRLLPLSRWIEERYRPPFGLSLLVVARAV